MKNGVFQHPARLDNPVPSRIDAIGNLINDYPDIRIPSKVNTEKPVIYPAVCNYSDFQVFAWHLSIGDDRRSFLAKEHKLYKGI
jgi:hypothetical protein